MIKGRKGHNSGKLVGLILGPLICILILSLPVPNGLNPMGQRALAGALWAVCWWMFEPFHLAVTSLWTVVIFGLLGVIKPGEAFQEVGTSTTMLFLGASLILGVWNESGLINRCAYKAMALKFVQGNPSRLLLAFGVACALMSAVVPNIPNALLFATVATAICKATGLTSESNLARSLVIMSGVGSAIGGIGTPIGGAPNLIVMGLIYSTLKYSVEFWQWSAMGLPLTLAGIILMGLSLKLFFPLREQEKISMATVNYIHKKIDELGPLSRYEKVAIGALSSAIFGWIFAQPIANAIPALAVLSKLLSTPFIALLIGCLLFTVPIDLKGPVFALNWQQGLCVINWSIIMFLMGAGVFGSALTKTGVDKWIAELVQRLLGNISDVWFLLIVILLTGLTTQVITNLALIMLLVSVTAQLAPLYGLNPIMTCILVGMVSNIGIMFPFSSPTIASAILGAEGYAKPKDLVLYGLAVVLMLSLTAFAVGLVIGPIIFR